MSFKSVLEKKYSNATIMRAFCYFAQELPTADLVKILNCPVFQL